MSVKTQILLGKEVRTMVVNNRHTFVNMNDVHKVAISIYGCASKQCAPSAYLKSLQAKAAVNKLNNAGFTAYVVVSNSKSGNVRNTYCHKDIASLYVTWMCKELKRSFDFFSKNHLNDVKKTVIDETVCDKSIDKVSHNEAMKALAVLTAYIGSK